MEIYYQGENITNMVQVYSCIVHDTCEARCDSLNIVFENAAGWYRWGPEEDDQIVVMNDGYSSGVMYLNMVMPEDGRYRILASSLPCKARKKEYKSYINQKIGDIMRSCAALSNMESAVFGIDADQVIPYIERHNEGCAAFLNRLLTLEGAVLKCINGKYTAIGIEYAQNLDAKAIIKLSAKQPGVIYKRNGMAIKGISVKTPYAVASAEDTAVSPSHAWINDNTLPVLDNIQAGRWARGKLLHLNRKCEIIEMESQFDPRFTAMVRFDINGETDANGEWLVEDVTHNLIELSTKVILTRCIRTVR